MNRSKPAEGALRLFAAATAVAFAVVVAGGCAGPTPPPQPAVPAARAAPPARSAPASPSIDQAALRRCRETAPPTTHPLRVVWRSPVFSSVFWSVDQWSRWAERLTSPVYESFFREKLGDDPALRDALAHYRKIRNAYSGRGEDDEPDPAHPIDLLVPNTTPTEKFARAFFCTGDARTAATLLGMKPAEIDEIGEAFDVLVPRVAPIVGAPYLTRALDEMRAMAERSKMTDFLDRMVDFYGVRSRVPGELTVEILWGPPKTYQATTLSDRMIIPISEKTAGLPKELASWVGVTVHEFGHELLSCITPEERHRWSDRILARGGLFRREHFNVIDEATQAAIGNLYFLRTSLPEGLDEDEVYDFEPRIDVPDAIDSLARRAEPLVARALESQETFGGAYLDRILDEQVRLVPPRLRDFARVGFLLAGSKHARRAFDGLFWGTSRFGYDLGTGDTFAVDSRKNRAASRWIVTTTDDLPAIEPIAERSEVAEVKTLASELARGHAEGCVQATRRPEGGGYDVVVIGRGSSGLRRMLIAIERGLTPKETERPRCVH